ncbi:MAG: prepilin peptidase [Verrucomicrobiota bacterium]
MKFIDLPTFLTLLVTALGATVGSFLNVCIHRMPRGLSVNKPRRSFCPTCNYQIPFHHNIPLASWLLLRGKCAECGSKISIRYWLVELLTAITFLWVWRWIGEHSEWQLAIVYWIFLSMLIVATFVDFEHFIIPDEVTKGGVVVGLLCAILVPSLFESYGIENRWHALGWSAFGAALGFFSLWAITALGNLAFGKKTEKIEGNEAWKIVEGEDDANPTIHMGSREFPMDDIFFVGPERVTLECSECSINDEELGAGTVVIRWDRVLHNSAETMFESIKKISGRATSMVISRQSMGFGDVKFLAMIGAFLGWKGVVSAIFVGSVAGTLVAVPLRLIGRQDWSAKIPFGPYLALGAIVWLFGGEEILRWYTTLIQQGYWDNP